MMHKKDYEEIANILRVNTEYHNNGKYEVKYFVYSELIENLCTFFKNDNSAFDKEMFKKAVGVY